MAILGYIPEKVTYVCSSPETVEEYFDFDDEEILISKNKVTPAFPVETGKKLDTAIKWTGLKNPKMIECENKPIKDIKVLGLEERGHGGRAYKVLIDNTYYVDMREDVILDTIISCGINAGGKLNGSFIWVKNGSNMKLIRTGSMIEKLFEKGTEIKNMPAFNKKDVVPGGIYSMKNGDIYLYLGEFFSYDYTYHEKFTPNRVGYGGTTTYHNEEFTKTKYKLFKRLYSYDYNGKYPTDIKKIINKDKDPYYYQFKKSIPAFIKQEAILDISNLDVVSEIVNMTEKYLLKDDGGKLNPYLHNLYVTHLCLGVKEPHRHKFTTKYTGVKIVG